MSQITVRAETVNVTAHLVECNTSLSYASCNITETLTKSCCDQRAKKVVSDSPGLVDFAIGLVNSVLNLPDGQAKIFLRIKITKVL